MLLAGKQFIKRSLQAPLSDLYWRFYGNTLKNPDIDRRVTSYLFVCMGNICRSPFAERMARRIFTETYLVEFSVVSAGIEVSAPFPPPDAAIVAARRFGVNMEDHQSVAITEDLVNRSDMILVMESSQYLALRGRYPEQRESIFLLPLFDGDRQPGDGNYHRYNIPDPYGRDLEHFVACYERIARCIHGLAAAIAGRDIQAKR